MSNNPPDRSKDKRRTPIKISKDGKTTTVMGREFDNTLYGVLAPKKDKG
jgi:hypothetical protein